jgi:hypothetical protein
MLELSGEYARQLDLPFPNRFIPPLGLDAAFDAKQQWQALCRKRTEECEAFCGIG